MATPEAAITPRRALIAGIAAAALGLSAFGASDANAAFTLAECQGAAGVRIQGASFQSAAQTYWRTIFDGSEGCENSTAPSYRGNGSGNGLASMGAGRGSSSLLCHEAGQCATPLDAGVRDPLSSMATTDEPPTPRQVADMQEGLPSTDADDGVLHQIPVATGATALIMHAPRGCVITTVTNKTDGSVGALGGSTGDSPADFTSRIRLTNEQVERVFAGVATTWGDIAAGITGTATGIPGGDDTNVGKDCDEVPIRRIVRQDVSGTTYGWKAFLHLINPGRGWLTTYSQPNTDWPGANGNGRATILRAQGRACTVGNNIVCTASSSSAGPLSDAVRATDGSIGYADLATARARGFEMTRAADQAGQDYTFWSPLQNNVGTGNAPTGYAEPTFDPSWHFAGGNAKGANCRTVAIGGRVPTPANSPNGDPTQGDWSGAYAAGGSAYPACVLTYALAWDDNAAVYGASAAEEAKARTIKDYLVLGILSEAGQTFTGQDYSALPNPRATPLQDWARAAADAIDWNKRSGGIVDPPREQPREQPRTQPRTDPQPQPQPQPQPVSNQFSIPSRRSSARQLTFTVELPGAGALSAVATARVGRRTIRVASARATAAGAGRVTVRLNLSAAARRALARAKSRRLKVDVAFTFTPNGGTARTVTQTVTVRAASRRAARRGRGRGRGRRAGRRAGKQKSAKR